eukprot:Clim_evm24s199 gene=Clim_evmTU24s199
MGTTTVQDLPLELLSRIVAMSMSDTVAARQIGFGSHVKQQKRVVPELVYRRDGRDSEDVQLKFSSQQKELALNVDSYKVLMEFACISRKFRTAAFASIGSVVIELRSESGWFHKNGTGTIIMHLAGKCHNIHSLGVIGSFADPDGTYPAVLVVAFRHIKALIEKAKSLQHIWFLRCRGFSYKDFAGLFSVATPGLTKLSMINCQKSSGNAVKALSELERPTSLTINSHCVIGADAIETLGEKASIEELSLRHVKEIKEPILGQAMMKSHHLKTVTLSNISGLSDCTMCCLRAASTCLDRLELGFCSAFTDAGLLYMAGLEDDQSVQRQRGLTTKCRTIHAALHKPVQRVSSKTSPFDAHDVDEDELSAADECSPTVRACACESMKFPGNQGADDGEVHLPEPISSRIRVLCIEHCGGISDRSMHGLARGPIFKNLTSLYLSMKNLTDRGIEYLCDDSGCPKLKILHLNGVSKLSNNAMYTIAQSHLRSQLLALRVASNNVITSDGMIAVVQMPGLQYLSMSFLMNVDDEFLHYVTETEDLGLRHLTIDGSVMMSSRSVTNLIRSRKEDLVFDYY